MILDSPRLSRRWVRIVPHVIDTVLLLSAVGLVVHIRQYPFGSAWLTAKVVALLFYIGLGMVALRFGRTLAIRTSAWVLALVVFAYIVSVAVTRSPLVFI